MAINSKSTLASRFEQLEGVDRGEAFRALGRLNDEPVALADDVMTNELSFAISSLKLSKP